MTTKETDPMTHPTHREHIESLERELREARATITRMGDSTSWASFQSQAEAKDRLSAELRDAKETITQLQARGTELVLERRSVDRRAQVREFFAAVGQAKPERPAVPDEASLRLGLRLIAEEFFELLDAALWINSADDDTFGCAVKDIFDAIGDAPVRVDMPDLIDACVDLEYVTEGLPIRLGVDLRPVWTAVHAANLAKMGGPKDEFGKIQKPAGWVAPDVARVLRDQGWTGDAK